jgi:hypothetical protein
VLVMITVVARVYRTLLFLYPADFRAQHGGEMTLDFMDGSHHARRVRGWRGLCSHWLRALVDLACTIAVQWLRTIWPVVGLFSAGITIVGWSAALRYFPTGAFTIVVDPRDQELLLLLVILLGTLIPIFGVVIFCSLFLLPGLGRPLGRRRV